MPLSQGTRLGPYEIITLIGVGGMGEVYRARDTRLGREVAVKVLKEELAADSVQRNRFQREAEVLAALNNAVGNPHRQVCARRSLWRKPAKAPSFGGQDVESLHRLGEIAGR